MICCILFPVFLSLSVNFRAVHFEKLAWNNTYFPLRTVKQTKMEMALVKGQIREAVSDFYYVYANGETYQTRGRENFRSRKVTPLIGDQVISESENQTDGYLLEVLSRKNQLVHPPVTSVDLGIIVTGIVEPTFSYNLLGRFPVTLEYESIEPIIFLTKTDLPGDPEKIEEVKQTYTRIGYPVIVLNHTGDMTKLIRYFPERLSVSVGQPGAGRLTLLNQISSELNLATGEISDALGRGRRTACHVELIPIYGGLVADTPRFSSIDFLTIEAGELPRQFPEFVEASVHYKFRERMHAKEPGCEVKHRAETGGIAQTRYDNYLQFLQEIEKRKPMYIKKEGKQEQEETRIEIAPSTLNADFANLQRDIELVEKGGVDYTHVDVMDGQLVPNITLGPNIVQTARLVTKLPLDVHLMIVDSENCTPAFAEAEVSIITVHVEATLHTHRTLQMTKSLGVKAGAVINPGIPVSMTKHVLPLADQVLVMTVNPGFGGQSFIEEIVEKIMELTDPCRENNWTYAIEVDGGIVPETAEICKDAGADVFVAGSYTYGAEDPVGQTERLKEALD